MRNECNIIRDILPLYVENIVSEDTVAFVEEHLEGCADCREELKSVRASAEIEKGYSDISDMQKSEAEALRILKRKMRRRRALTILLSFLTAVVLVGGILSMFLFIGFPSEAEDIKLETEFQYDRKAYLNQHFTLHIYQMQDKSLFAHAEDVYQRDENGELVYDEYGHKILCGYEIKVRESPWENVDPNNYHMSYAYEEETAPAEDFDFTITVIFKDTTVVYSMREEGLFEFQEDIERYIYDVD